ncbi:ATP-binding protein [Acidovorax sp. SUPP2825]|uniref:hybrid sensor histidine kinase/response regulator n=1 Tax=Acidovorax sp. SUPP2825 TaxID=2920879 RepID=UPI0024E089C2|nr:ATP-binding protein [Acidovorax sp. SUPP2825]
MPSGVTDRPLRILHLEDSVADHELACITLRRANVVYEIHHVDTLTSFMERLDAEPFDLILADYRLPGFTALDAWSVVAQREPHPPFVLLSGAIGEAAAVDAMRLGIADYLLKDDMARLPHVIDRAIEVHEARRAREKATADLAASERRLAELTEHLQSSIEKERAAIAREIHDDIGGALSAVRFDVGWISRHAKDDGMQAHAAAATEMLQHAIEASQRIMMNLRPPILDQGLVAAVQWLAESFERRTGIPTRVHTSKDTIHVDAAIQLVAYRTAQEALTNVFKYAEARQVGVDLSDSEGVLTLEVTDDGRGMEPAMREKPKSFGLKGLQERARTVGGWLDISSHPGRGTAVILSVPLTPQNISEEEAP